MDARGAVGVRDQRRAKFMLGYDVEGLGLVMKIVYVAVVVVSPRAKRSVVLLFHEECGGHLEGVRAAISGK